MSVCSGNHERTYHDKGGSTPATTPAASAAYRRRTVASSSTACSGSASATWSTTGSWGRSSPRSWNVLRVGGPEATSRGPWLVCAAHRPLGYSSNNLCPAEGAAPSRSPAARPAGPVAEARPRRLRARPQLRAHAPAVLPGACLVCGSMSNIKILTNN